MRVPSAVRRLTDPVVTRVRVPIVGGLNRGAWWSLASAGSGYASGRRGRAQMEVLAALMRPGDVVWDVGAHHGYVTLLAARIVGPRGAVHAFEPSAANRRRLERHLRWNRATNVRVHGCALADHEGEATFGSAGSSKTMALGGGGECVAVRRADQLVRAGQAASPTFLKIDVEGAEAEAVEGMLGVVPPHARMLIGVHHREADARLSAMLEARGWELIPSAALRRARAGTWGSDPDLYCIGPAWAERDADRARLERARF